MLECSVREYIETATSLEGRVGAIEALIDAMLLNAASAVEDSGIISYSLDDGQMKVMTEYRSFDQIEKGIQRLERLKQIYVNRINGNITVLRGRLNY